MRGMRPDDIARLTNVSDPRVSPDGQRFLMIKDTAWDQTSTPASMVVVLNWLEELKAQVPAK